MQTKQQAMSLKLQTQRKEFTLSAIDFSKFECCFSVQNKTNLEKGFFLFCVAIPESTMFQNRERQSTMENSTEMNERRDGVSAWEVCSSSFADGQDDQDEEEEEVVLVKQLRCEEGGTVFVCRSSPGGERETTDLVAREFSRDDDEALARKLQDEWNNFHLAKQLEDADYAELAAKELEDLEVAEALQRELHNEDRAEQISTEEKDRLVAEELERQLNGDEEMDLELAQRLHEKMNVQKRISFADILKKKPQATFMADSSPSYPHYSRQENEKTAHLNFYMSGEDLKIEMARWFETNIHHASRLRKDAAAMSASLGVIDRARFESRQLQTAEANEDAAGIFFVNRNRRFAEIVLHGIPSESVEVDFHYLFVDEAVGRFGAVLEIAKDVGWEEIVIVCGAGTNSVNQKARLAPALKKTMINLRDQGKAIKRISEHGQGNFLITLIKVNTRAF